MGIAGGRLQGRALTDLRLSLRARLAKAALLSDRFT
jgi:hypothetical protein